MELANNDASSLVVAKTYCSHHTIAADEQQIQEKSLEKSYMTMLKWGVNSWGIVFTTTRVMWPNGGNQHQSTI